MSEAELINDLLNQVSREGRDHPLLEEVRSFASLAPDQQRAKLPEYYLVLENFIIHLDTGHYIDGKKLRGRVREKYSDLFRNEAFELIFQPRNNQEFVLARQYINQVITETRPILGMKYDYVRVWLSKTPGHVTTPLPLGIVEMLPVEHPEWMHFFQQLSMALYTAIKSQLGHVAIDNAYRRAYEELYRVYYGLEMFGVVVKLMPKSLIDREKLAILRNHSYVTGE